MKYLDVDLIIFDLDGTLAETRYDLASAANYALRKMEKEALEVKEVVSFVGKGINVLLESCLGNPTETELQTARQYFDKYYTEHMTDVSCLYPGIRELLQAISPRKKAILSNKAQIYTDLLVDKLGIRLYFDMVIGGQGGFRIKPDPEAIFYILEKLNISPERAVIIGDTDNDILAGKAAGIFTCAVSFGFRSAEELQLYQPDMLVNNAIELKRVLAAG